MAIFESRIHALRIEPHPGSDRLDIAAVGHFRCIVAKSSFADGDLGLEPLFLPGGGPPESWIWRTLRRAPEEYAGPLRLGSVEMTDIAGRREAETSRYGMAEHVVRLREQIKAWKRGPRARTP